MSDHKHTVALDVDAMARAFQPWYRQPESSKNRFRKKSVVIEAVQFKRADSMEDLTFNFDGEEAPQWLINALNDETITPQEHNGRVELWAKALEGGHWVSWGDWIIRGIKGELHPGCQVDHMIAVAREIIAELNKKSPCRENAIAVTKLDEALMWLRERKRDRVRRGVEGYDKA